MAARRIDLPTFRPPRRRQCRPADAPAALSRRPLPALRSRWPCALLLAVAVLLPLVAVLAKSVREPDGSFAGLANFRRFLADPALAGSVANSLTIAALSTVDLRRAGLRLRLWPHPHPDARSGPVPGHRPDPDPRAFAPAGDQPRLPLRQPGAGQGSAVRPLDLRADRHRHGRGVLDLPARADHPDHGPGHVRRAALRGGLRAQGGPVPDLHDRHPAGGALWAGQRRLVVFALVITDFGVPKVVGGHYNVLATDVYKQVVGQQNFQMGAVVGLVLLLPAVLAFVVDRFVQRRQAALLSARAVPLVPAKDRRSTRFSSSSAHRWHWRSSPSSLVAAFASLATYWPYNLTPSLEELRLRHDGWRRLGQLPQLAGHGGTDRPVRHCRDLHRRLAGREDAALRAGSPSRPVPGPAAAGGAGPRAWAWATCSSSTTRPTRWASSTARWRSWSSAPSPTSTRWPT